MLIMLTPLHLALEGRLIGGGIGFQKVGFAIIIDSWQKLWLFVLLNFIPVKFSIFSLLNHHPFYWFVYVHWLLVFMRLWSASGTLHELLRGVVALDALMIGKDPWRVTHTFSLIFPEVEMLRWSKRASIRSMSRSDKNIIVLVKMLFLHYDECTWRNADNCLFRMLFYFWSCSMV